MAGIKPFALSFAGIGKTRGGLELRLANEATRSFRLEASTNLSDWSEVSFFTPRTNQVIYLDNLLPTEPRRFYRATAP